MSTNLGFYEEVEEIQTLCEGIQTDRIVCRAAELSELLAKLKITLIVRDLELFYDNEEISAALKESGVVTPTSPSKEALQSAIDRQIEACRAGNDTGNGKAVIEGLLDCYGVELPEGVEL